MGLKAKLLRAIVIASAKVGVRRLAYAGGAAAGIGGTLAEGSVDFAIQWWTEIWNGFRKGDRAHPASAGSGELPAEHAALPSRRYPHLQPSPRCPPWQRRFRRSLEGQQVLVRRARPRRPQILPIRRQGAPARGQNRARPPASGHRPPVGRTRAKR